MRARPFLIKGVRVIAALVALFLLIATVPAVSQLRKWHMNSVFLKCITSATDDTDAGVRATRFVAGIKDPEVLRDLALLCESRWRDVSVRCLYEQGWISCIRRLGELGTEGAVRELVFFLTSGYRGEMPADWIAESLVATGPPAIPYLERVAAGTERDRVVATRILQAIREHSENSRSEDAR